MNDKPRKHHFVPQFWIRRFAGSDGRLWAYDHDSGRISVSDGWHPPISDFVFLRLGSCWITGSEFLHGDYI